MQHQAHDNHATGGLYISACICECMLLCIVLANKVMAKSSYIYRECMRPAKDDAQIKCDDQLGFIHTCTEAAKGKTVWICLTASTSWIAQVGVHVLLHISSRPQHDCSVLHETQVESWTSPQQCARAQKPVQPPLPLWSDLLCQSSMLQTVP